MRNLIFAAILVAGCAEDAGAERAATQALGASTVYHLTNANVTQLRSIDFQVTQRIQSGNLQIELCLKHDPVYNAVLGVDQFLYSASAPPYGILSVNEPGWSLNFDGTQADGFGSFASRKSAKPAGHGGISCAAPLVFTLDGDPTAGTNLPLELAIHVRFDGDCSGWVSNRPYNGTPGSATCCRRLPDCPPQPPVCRP